MSSCLEFDVFNTSDKQLFYRNLQEYISFTETEIDTSFRGVGPLQSTSLINCQSMKVTKEFEKFVIKYCLILIKIAIDI